MNKLEVTNCDFKMMFKIAICDLEEQTKIYYACGESNEKVDAMPQVELLKDKGNYNPEKDGSEFDYISKLLSFWE